MKTSCCHIMLPLWSLEWEDKRLRSLMKLESSHPGDLRLCHRISLGNLNAGTRVFEVASLMQV